MECLLTEASTFCFVFQLVVLLESILVLLIVYSSFVGNDKFQMYFTISMRRGEHCWPVLELSFTAHLFTYLLLA